MNVINFVAGWYEYSVNMSWFILKIIGVDLEQKKIMYSYYTLRAMSQLFSLFSFIISVSCVILYKNIWSEVLFAVLC